MSPICVKIEMPPYLQKFIISFSTNKPKLNSEAVELPPRHEYNRVLINMVSNMRNTHPVDTSKEHIKIRLPYNYIKDVFSYNKLGWDNREKFRQIIKSDFFLNFKMFLKEATLSGYNKKEAIELFFLDHNITEDDLKLESYYRKYHRYLEKKRASVCDSLFTHKVTENVRCKSLKL